MSGKQTSDNQRYPLIVGLTGGIATGKTTVSDRFAALGVDVVDTDQLARDIVQPGSAGLAAIREAFGSGVIAANGQLDRQALRGKIFNDEADRARLEQILHPRILEQMRDQLSACTSPYAIAVIPLLIEANWVGYVDRVLVVDAPPSLQRERLMSRDQRSEIEADQVLASQTTRANRLAIADDVIRNDGNPQRLIDAVATLDKQYRDYANALSVFAHHNRLERE